MLPEIKFACKTSEQRSRSFIKRKQIYLFSGITKTVFRLFAARAASAVPCPARRRVKGDPCGVDLRPPPPWIRWSGFHRGRWVICRAADWARLWAEEGEGCDGEIEALVRLCLSTRSLDVPDFLKADRQHPLQVLAEIRMKFRWMVLLHIGFSTGPWCSCFGGILEMIELEYGS